MDVRDAPDRGATEFEALVVPHVAESYRLAAAIVGIDDAKDVAQDALLDAWRSITSLRDPSRVRAWLLAIVVNRARNHLRRRGRRPALTTLTDSEPAPEARRQGVDPVSIVAERDRFDRAFARLSPEHRVVLALRYSVGLTGAEVATVLAIPEGTVRSRTAAASEHMRRAIAAEDA